MNAQLKAEQHADLVRDDRLSRIPVVMPADIDSTRLYKLLAKVGAENQITADLPQGCNYVDLAEFARKEDLKIDYIDGQVILRRQHAKARGLIDAVKGFFSEPQSF